ncbi:MAG TPA: aldolase/citrate lyase family protein [Streptosporangiaceae bacterium]
MTRLDPAALAGLDRLLASADRELTARYPGAPRGRQPVHTCYVPADQLRQDQAAGWGRQAAGALADFAPDDDAFAAAMGLAPAMAAQVRPLVLAKLAAEPVEDLRIDFEDGYLGGDEDADARAAAGALAADVAAGRAPAFTGLRCKSLEPASRSRAVRSLELFLETLLGAGPLPDGFVITLPKVTSAAQVNAMARLCELLEQAYLLRAGRLAFEIQVETPQLILGADGAAEIARCVHAGAGRLTGLHYGTYDYSASLGIAAAYQSMDHPAADHARAVMQVAAAGTGVRLSDGSSNVLPGGDRDEVTAAWQLHARLVLRSLERGFYQGWDLHPWQLASRYAATYAFFREQLPAACARLRGYAGGVHHGVLEEPATGRALAGYLGRALDCGAVTEEEIVALAGRDRATIEAMR